MKRLFDITLLVATSIIWVPLCVLIAVLCKIKFGSPILFRQVRSGFCGRPFVLYKYRTMQNTYGADQKLLPDSERMMPFGNFLRMTSLDELPEFWNVIKGDMSLVGPRPLLMEYLTRYSAEQARRHEVKPGITGWAQINGRNSISWEDKFKYDVWYVDNASIKLDLKILLRTFKKVFRREGVNGFGHATMSEFLGSIQKKE